MEHKEPPQDLNLKSNIPPTSKEPHAMNEEELSPSVLSEETMHELGQGYKYKSYCSPKKLLTNISTGIRTRSSIQIFCAFSSFVWLIEHKNHLVALYDPNWVIAVQEELAQFKRNLVWFLTP